MLHLPTDIVWQYAISGGQSPESARRRRLFILKCRDLIQSDQPTLGMIFLAIQTEEFQLILGISQ
jgi:hypothetical protein